MANQKEWRSKKMPPLSITNQGHVSSRYSVGYAGELGAAKAIFEATGLSPERIDKLWDYEVNGWRLEIKTATPKNGIWSFTIGQVDINEPAEYYVFRFNETEPIAHLLMRGPIGKRSVRISLSDLCSRREQINVFDPLCEAGPYRHQWPDPESASQIFEAARLSRDAWARVANVEVNLRAHVGVWINEWVERHGSLRSLSRQLGFSAAYICDIQHGKRTISREFLTRLERLPIT